MLSSSTCTCTLGTQDILPHPHQREKLCRPPRYPGHPHPNQREKHAVIQMVQITIWFMAGVAKLGPWFKYVVQFMSQNNVIFNVYPEILRTLFRRLPKRAAAVGVAGLGRGAGTSTTAGERANSNRPEGGVSLQKEGNNCSDSFDSTKTTTTSPKNPPPRPKGTPLHHVDMRPSLFCRTLAYFGAALEILMPTVLVLGPEIPEQHRTVDLSFLGDLVNGLAGFPAAPFALDLQLIGLLAATLFHVYIMLQLPLASVFHWNVSTIVIAWRVFGAPYLAFFGFAKFNINPVGGAVPLSMMADLLMPREAASLSSLLLSLFLWIALILLPVYGQLFPKNVPFMLAYRPYAGNWRWQVLVFDQKGPVPKKLRRFSAKKTFEPLDTEEALNSFPITALRWPAKTPNYCRQFSTVVCASILTFPNYRPLLSVVEALQRRKRKTNEEDAKAGEEEQPWSNEIGTVFGEILATRVLGFGFGYGWPQFRPSFREALREGCGLKAGEAFLVQFEPMGLLQREVEVRVMDVGKTTAGQEVVYTKKISWRELESSVEPAGLVVEGVDADLRL